MKGQLIREHPTVGACGLACGLCPRYYTVGASRCPGCCGPGFWEKHPACGFITCVVKTKGLETCAECRDFDVCERLSGLFESAKLRDSFISYRHVEDDLRSIRKQGIAEFVRRVDERQAVLRRLIDGFDDGRSRGFYCSACQLLPLDSLHEGLEAVSLAPNADIKERARAMRAILGGLAERAGIDLELRK